MHKTLILLSAAMLTATAASAINTLDVRGTLYTVDTLFHAKVGPGTTQTSLRLINSSGDKPLNVFYLTVDRTTPGVSIRTVCAGDKVAGGQTVRGMATSHSHDGLHYFAGSNGDFYSTSGTATNGSSVIGTPTASTIVDREIYKTSNSNYQFSVDTDGVPRVCRLNYYTGTAAIGESTTLFKGVNVSSPANGITLYTPRYWGSANQTDHAGACHQVSARLAEGSAPFHAGGEFDLVVTSEPSTDGDMAIPDDGYVIHGRGTSTSGCNTGADAFVAALKPGDIVHFNNIILTPEGEAIHPVSVVSGNPKNVGNGETLESEGERGDAPARHPRTCIGYSQDGNKIIMMVIDGRTGYSVGVATGMAGDIMRYAGAYEAVNLDGGGSSTLYTEALGVRNYCSDGKERAVGNAVFAVLEAPEDNEIAEIAFCDWATSLPHYGIYTPVIYGFNKYGKLIDTDVKGFTLTSDAGTVSADGSTLTASNKGTYALQANLGNLTASIPVTVTDAEEVMPKYPDVLINTSREWTVEMLAKTGNKWLPASAIPYDWSSDNPDVATVDGQGLVTPLADGKAVITGLAGNVRLAVNLTVETPVSVTMPIETTHTIDPWAFSGTSITKGFTTTALDNGFSVDFTLSSARAPSFTARLDKPIFSLPEAVQLRVVPQDVKVTKIVAVFKANNEQRTQQLWYDTAPLTTGEENTITLKLSDIFNLDDIGIYPITLSSVCFYLNGSTKTPYSLKVPGVEGVYDAATLGVEDIINDSADADKTRNEPRQWYNIQGIPVEKPTRPGIYVAPDTKMIIK